MSRLRERLSHRSPEDLSAEASAMTLVHGFVRALRSAGAERVVLFGSLADGRFRQGSDIDLAVGGLSERALSKFEHEFTILARRPVELTNLRSMSAPLRENVDRFGLDLT